MSQRAYPLERALLCETTRHALPSKQIKVRPRTSWTDQYLREKLGNKFEIIIPRMPLPENAKYNEWKLHFERHIPGIKSGVILIGISLGGIFLAKYLSENKFPKKITATYLIAPPFDNSDRDYDLVGGFKLGSNLDLLQKNSPNLNLMFSKDDEVVPQHHLGKYKEKLPSANFINFKSKNGHFRITRFPGIARMIKKDTQKK